MKKITLLFSLLLTATLIFGQSDTIHLHFKAKHMGFIAGVVSDRGDANLVNVFNQAAAQLQLKDSLGKKWVKDTAQLLTVVAKEELVPILFTHLGSKAERVATNYNNEMRDLLLKDLMRKPELLQEVFALMERNAADTWLIVLSGFDYLITIKQ